MVSIPRQTTQNAKSERFIKVPHIVDSNNRRDNPRENSRRVRTSDCTPLWGRRQGGTPGSLLNFLMAGKRQIGLVRGRSPDGSDAKQSGPGREGIPRSARSIPRGG